MRSMLGITKKNPLWLKIIVVWIIEFPREGYKIRKILGQKSTYTKSLVNANSFYANFTNTTFQKSPIPHLTCTMKQKIPSLTWIAWYCINWFSLTCLTRNSVKRFFPRTKSSVNEGVGVLNGNLFNVWIHHYGEPLKNWASF